MKKLKKIIVPALALALTVSGLAISPSQSEAAKLNKKRVTIKVGKSVKLKVKGTRKKVKWSSSASYIASVSKAGRVKGKYPGIATITAKAGKKRYRCKVTVKRAASKSTPSYPSYPSYPKTPVRTPAPSPAPTVKNPETSNVNTVSTDQLAANIAVKIEKIPTGALLTVTNNNKQQVQYLDVNYVLKTAAGVTVTTSSKGFTCLDPGKSQTYYIWLVDNEVELFDAAKSTASCTVSQYTHAIYKDVTASLVETAEVGTDNDIYYTVKNTASSDIDGNYIVFFYDAKGDIVDAANGYLDLKANETETKSIYAPSELNEDFDRVPAYTSYKIIAYAHTYTSVF